MYTRTLSCAGPWILARTLAGGAFMLAGAPSRSLLLRV